MREPSRNVRYLSYAIVFGALWGAVEMTAGGLLHALRVPFSGVLLAAVGAGVLACQRTLLPLRGITLTTGCLAAGLKVLSMGGIFPNALLAVLAEAVMAEGVFSLLGANRISSGLAGLLMGGWSLAQALVTLGLLYGTGWIEAVATRLPALGLPPSVPAVTLPVLAAVLLLGLSAGTGLLGHWTAARVRGPQALLGEPG